MRLIAYQAQTGRVQANLEELCATWAAIHPDTGEPIDPYDGTRFGYQVAETGEYWIWSLGPDSSTEANDIYLALSTMSRSSLRRCFTRKAFAVSSSAPHRSS